MIDVYKVSGIGEIFEKNEKERTIFAVQEEGKAFLVKNKNTVEVRCDGKLGKLLREKYESVMESRYFGRGGIEIVDSGQMTDGEIEDLVRLSYNLSLEKE